ncbi:hypothetical protein RirG_231090 [Rhizophagus irregularis DAOM 197198w]|uniref:Uncharacterized protein n=1 Tax=Rhizophagus irregularis (strain DAOM 197198w) TaxID=1432141 RepID=A0A015K5W3_RHIIW|nr:hypothetical protein RirG_231090 [Rhizophagus irregularis DAOM 197198w]
MEKDLDHLVKFLEPIQLEDLKIRLGFTPTRMIRPGRRARLLPPESENNPIPPHIIVVNIVIKNSETKSISNSINAHDQNAKRSE